MAKRRGFFAELQHQTQLAQKRQQVQSSANARAHAASVKRAEAARRQAERAQAQFARASAAEQKAAEKELKRLHEESMAAEVDERNAELASQYAEIDSLLAATLDVDDYVNLEDLRSVASHPPFSRSDLELTRPRLAPIETPPEPTFARPAGEPKGLGGVFGGKKKYAEELARAEAEFAAVHHRWQADVAALPSRQAQQDAQYEQAEAARRIALEHARQEYDRECQQREATTAAENAQLDTLIANLAYDVEEAVQEYVSIVLSNSIYPECFLVEHEFEFNATLRELNLTALIPAPNTLPSVKEYRYVKAKDEISSSALPSKEQKERFANAAAQVALRTLQEVFEADRAGKIRTIALTVACDHLDAATGVGKRTPLVAVAAERDTFLGFDLRNVVPQATLQHMGALISKSPFDLVAIDTSKGVRSR